MKEQNNFDLQRFNQKDIEQMWHLIRQASNIILLTHYKPDGDGISSCVALDFILRKMGKTVETIYPNLPDRDYRLRPSTLLINGHTLTPDLIIALDTANYERLYFPKEFEGIPFINIDHHISNSLRGDINFIYADVSSASELLFLLIYHHDQSLIDVSVSEALLFGILYDSSVFHTQSTSSRTLRIAAELIDRGVNLFKLKCELLEHKDPKAIKLWARLLDRIEVDVAKNVAWGYVSLEDLRLTNLSMEALFGFNDFFANMFAVDVTMLFVEVEGGKTKVSLRSKKADVNAIASRFGGGGHKNASGILSNKSIHELAAEVLASL